MIKTPRTAAFTIVLSAALSAFASETPDQLRDQGLEALKAAQSDDTKIVEAARLLAQAAEAYEKAGNDDTAAELNSYLYWCKKRMTLAQTEAFAGTGDSGKRVVEKLEAVATQKVEAGEVGQWMKRAEDFEAAHPKDPLLCAIRYFEVADRFTGTQESLVAQRKSLDILGKLKVSIPAKFSPVGEWIMKHPNGRTYKRIFLPDNTYTTANYYPAWANGTWSVNGKIVTFTSANGKTSSCSIAGSNKIVSNEDRRIVFERITIPRR